MGRSVGWSVEGVRSHCHLSCASLQSLVRKSRAQWIYSLHRHAHTLREAEGMENVEVLRRAIDELRHQCRQNPKLRVPFITNQIKSSEVPLAFLPLSSIPPWVCILCAW